MALICLVAFLWDASHAIAQHGESGSVEEQAHHHGSGAKPSWEGSAQGIAYSEFNHHWAGVFLLLIGLSEIRQALGWTALRWTRFLLPGAFAVGGIFLLIWSDHDSWPIGSLTFVQTFFGGDPEILQHKTYGVLAVAIGAIEGMRRVGWLTHAAWIVPLPLFAIVGGLMLFSHAHGDHPAAHKIALHHAIMGTLAITAGSSKLMSGWRGRQFMRERSHWELIWASLVFVIGLQLLIYSE
ncbi:MAG: hypothetical protein H0V35_10100 [Nitrospira sp.]|nr:hypothetical protein [Nitrospira sp.]